MKMIDIAARAARSLKTAKGRTILTSLAIAVGALTLTVTMAAGNGIRAYTDRLVANNFDPAESIVGRDKEIENTGPSDSSPKEYDASITSMSFGAPGSSIQIKQLTDDDITEIKNLSFIETVRPMYAIDARYITREGHKKYTLSITAFNPGQKPELVAGVMPQSDITTGQILLPEPYVSLLGLGDAEKAVGQTVEIVIQQPFSETAIKDYVMQSLQAGASGEAVTSPQNTKTVTYTIAGVTKKGVASVSNTGLPVYVGTQDAKDLYDFTTKGTANYGKYQYASVRVRGGEDNAKAESAKTELKRRGYYAMTSQDIQKTIRQFVDILQILVAVFGVITIVASIFGIVNTMYISVLERTREIGLMKALGMRGRHVAWLFRLEAAWIGLLGGAIGAGLAVLIGMLLNPWITEKLSLGAGNYILIFDWLQIALLIISLMLVAIIAGWFPARKAARLDPIEALRAE